MNAALLLNELEEKITHMLCYFHLFDVNAKKHVQPFLTFGASSWPKFRSGLSACLETDAEEEFEKQWNHLLETHLKLSNTSKPGRYYMTEHL